MVHAHLAVNSHFLNFSGLKVIFLEYIVKAVHSTVNRAQQG